jgi:arylsulfatase A-like enzyme
MPAARFASGSVFDTSAVTVLIGGPLRMLERKRCLMNRWVLLATAGLLMAMNSPATAQEAAPIPNIVFIMADDLGYGDLSCYGQKKFTTPNIDRLAAEGLRFTDYYAGATVCAPSRCVLMTGLHTGHCYIRGNSKQYLRPGDVTLAEMLKNGGYTCGQFGKWGLGGEKTAGQPTLQGFDTFYGYLDQHHAHNYFPTFLIKNKERVALTNVVPNEDANGGGIATERNQYSPDLIVGEALKFIDDNKTKPFFLYLSITLPHANNEAKAKGMEIPDYGQFKNEDWPEPQKGLAAMIKRLDDHVGKVMEKLNEAGVDGNTLVLFTSDNGPHREGGNDPDFFDSNGPLRGIKRDLYEGGIRVPLIARWPGRITKGTTTGHQAYHGDMFATFCDLTGARTLPDLDSVSLAPLFTGKPQEQLEHKYLYWEFHERGFAQAVRHGEWKAVRDGGEKGKLELYNLVDDPGETMDIAGTQKDVARQMALFMNDAHLDSRDWPIKTEKKKPDPKAAAK